MDVTAARARKILYVITKPNWGGAQRYVHDLAIASQEAGYEVTVACGSAGELTDRLEAAHIPCVTVRGLGRDVAPLSDLRALHELTRLMRALMPDVVHGNSSKAGLLAAIAARRSRVPRSIFTAHGWAFNESRPWWQKWVFALFHLLTVWCVDSVICVSAAVARQAWWMPLAKHKLTIIRNGISAVALMPKDEARAALAPSLSAETWIGSLAELHPTKGLDVLIQAFIYFADSFPDTALVLIGDGQARARLEALIPAELTSRVVFCGHIAEAPKYLNALSLFAFPSRSEALGFALLEAGTASLPVVASRVGGIPEIIENGKGGLLVTPNDPVALSSALSDLLTHPEKAASLGKVLHEKVLRDFSKELIISKTLRLYR